MNLKISDIDRNFIAARVEQGPGKQMKNMYRFMFFEAFVRVSI